MNRSTLARRYAPLAVVVAVQLLLIAVVPSTSIRSAGQSVDAGGNAAGADSLAGEAAGSLEGGTEGGLQSGPGAVGAGGGGGEAGSTGTAPGAPPGVPPGDTSHCVKGRQFDPGIAYWAPPCVPGRPGAPFRNNGGKTYTGVTENQITIVDYVTNFGAQVNAILEAQGLLVTYERARVIDRAYENFLNRHYNFYGRKVKIITYQGQCQSVPPDKKCLLPEMDRLVKTYNPYMVFWPTTLCSECFSRLAQNKVVAVGGIGFSDDFAKANYPYFWAADMSLTRMSRLFSDWWCGQMSSVNAPDRRVKFALPNNPAQNFNGQKRVLGIIATNDPDNQDTVQKFLYPELKRKCGEVVRHEYFYDQDINTAAKQVAAGIAAMDKPGDPATTVLCLCDSVAPSFLYNGEQSNNYYPENILADVQGMGYDTSGQSYGANPDGSPSLACPEPSKGCVFDGALGLLHSDPDRPGPEMEGMKIFKLGGGEGNPPTTPLVTTTRAFQWVMMANLIQNTGPNLTPQNMAARAPAMGTVGGGETGRPLLGFTEGNTNWTLDVRLVYWNKHQASPYNGKKGKYVSAPLSRFSLGQFPSKPAGPDIPPPLERR